MTKLETFIPKSGDKLIFLGNEKFHSEYMTVGVVYAILSHKKDTLYYYDDMGERHFFEALIKSYWEEVKWNN